MSDPPTSRASDPSFVAGIAREVIRRLREGEGKAKPMPAERLITIETLDRYAGVGEIAATDDAVITPAAREEAARRMIKITAAKSNSCAGSGDQSQAADEGLDHQLVRRGIRLPAGIDVVWTETPAAEVFRRCSGGRRAAMVTAISDVERFSRELDPQVWVLDREKLNLTAAINVVRRISRGNPSPRPTDNGGSR